MALEGMLPGVGVGTAARFLTSYAIERGIVQPEDRRWAYNRIVEASGQYGEDAPEESASLPAGFDFEDALSVLAEAGVAAGTAEDSATGRDRVCMRIMGAIMPRPSEISRHFWDCAKARGTEAATDWFYSLCCDVDYVRRSAIARNLAWTTSTGWGDLQITINKSKPEKDPRDIAAAASVTAGEKYPACQLCRENEGYSGRPAAVLGGHPARQNLRIVPVELCGEEWGFQYSPYAYYSEHCIVMSSVHRPMRVDRTSMARLVAFVDKFPHYFIGSNADLPIVGGSILSHDHFQGGRHEFPMAAAPITREFQIPGFPQVKAGVIKWPLTVLRLSGADPEPLLDAADHVVRTWRAWTDASVGVYAQMDGVPHNTVTPIARKRGDAYELDLALRCNVTTPEHSLGVFHPHEELHHIKKENIGLIEVMGLAILPARLEPEMAAVRRHLLDGDYAALESDPASKSHAKWARALVQAHPEFDEETAQDVLREGIGQVFGRVLEDAGVFKWDDAGRAALGRFIASL